MSAEESFFSRWARRKAQARGPAALVDPARPEPGSEGEVARQRPPATSSPRPVSDGAVQQAPAPTEALTLADVQRLQPGEEIARFMARQVAPEVRRAALKKLFADPHFQVMDGLDVYIDDYSVPSPLAPEEVAQLLGREGLLGRHSLGLGEQPLAAADAQRDGAAPVAPDAYREQPMPEGRGWAEPAPRARAPDEEGALAPVGAAPAQAARSDGPCGGAELQEATATGSGQLGDGSAAGQSVARQAEGAP